MKITIIVAMKSEAEPIIESLNIKRFKGDIKFGKTLPTEIYTGNHNDISIKLFYCGLDPQNEVDCIGTQSAILTTFLAIETHSPDLIINAGTAGGFLKESLTIGSVILGDLVRHHDRRLPVPGFTEYGIGNYKLKHAIKIGQALNIRTGVVSTGNSFNASIEELREMTSNKTIAKDMEAAAIAWIAELYDIPLVVIKSITDLVDSPANDVNEFYKNFDKAIAELTKNLKLLINYFDKSKEI